MVSLIRYVGSGVWRQYVVGFSFWCRCDDEKTEEGSERRVSGADRDDHHSSSWECPSESILASGLTIKHGRYTRVYV